MTNKIDKISVVMSVRDEAEALEKNLPLFLTQQSKRAVEVIIVDDDSTDDTPNVLKRMKATYPNLYTTFIPKSPPNPWRRRLALTIGAKAAKGDWVVLADIGRPPRTETSLENMADAAEEMNSEVLIAFTSRKSSDSNIRYQSWDDIDEASTLLRKAERRGGNGHRGRWLKMRRGIYDAIAVPREHVHDALRYFDEQLRGFRLMGLRMKVLFH